MGVLYMPFFDASAVSGLGTITLATAGETNIVVDLSALSITSQDGESASSIFAHSLSGAFTKFITYPTTFGSIEFRFPHYAGGGFDDALETAIIAEATTQGWSSPGLFTVVFNLSTARYSIAWPTAAFTVTFSNDLTRQMLGFSGTQSGASSYTATRTPLYVINSTLQDVSEESDLYEAPDIGNHLITDNGTGTGASRTHAPQYKDWVQQFETHFKTHVISGVVVTALNDPFTHESLYRHCRGEWPFILYGPDRNGGTFGLPQVYSLRTEGISFRPQRAAPGSGSQFHIPYNCVFEGTVGLAT